MPRGQARNGGRPAGAAAARLRAVVLAASGVALMVGAWWLLSAWLGETRAPSPSTVVDRFFATISGSAEIRSQGGRDGFAPNALITALRYVEGTGLGLLLGFAGVYACLRFPRVRALTVPIVEVLRAVPPLATAPFLLLWFGPGAVATVGVVVFYTFVIVFVAGLEADDRLDPVTKRFAATLGADRGTIARSVALPAIVPQMAGPIRVATTWSWGLVVVGELLGAQDGIGRLFVGFVPLVATDLVVVGIVWIVLMALVAELVVSAVLRRATSWAPASGH